MTPNAQRLGIAAALLVAAGGVAVTMRAASNAGATTITTSNASTHVSVGKPAFASEGTASLLTDGKYRSPSAWRFTPSHCTPTTPCWGAVHVGSGPSTLLVDWSYQDGAGDFDTSVWGGQTLTNYSVLVSADSTNGSDGTWSAAVDALTNRPVTVSGNTFIQRSHLIAFSGFSWVKLAITSATASAVDELDLWDASTKREAYFFHGDSITHRCANLRGSGGWHEQPSFQVDVQSANAARFPLQVGGGIVSQGAADAEKSIPRYLELFRPVKYWFLTMGTNDLCGGAASFVSHAQAWIDMVKSAGAIPILVHPMWANDSAAYCHQNGPSFNAAIDALAKSARLGPAVPLYEATVGHPEYFEPGDVHPNAAGCAVWNRTLATAVSSLP